MKKQIKYSGPQRYVTYPGYGHFLRDQVVEVSLEAFQLLVREPGFQEVRQETKEKKAKEVNHAE